MRLHWCPLLLAAALLLLGRAAADFDDENHDAVDDAVERLLAAVRHPDALGGLVRAAAGPQDDACQRAVLQWATALKAKQKWAMEMLDSSAKLVTGVLYGNQADLGNFDECVQAASPEGFTGRYILPRLAITVQNTTVSVRAAACVPSPCTRPVLAAALQRAADAVNKNKDLAALGLHLSASLADKATAVAGLWRDPGAADYVVIVICALLAMLVALGTALDLCWSDLDKKSLGRGASLLLAFSAWTNGRRLLTVAPPSDSNFTCINGIRFFSAAWVVLGHRYIAMMWLPFMNLIVVKDRFSDLSTMLLFAAPLSVDTFFCIGGLVNCYVFMKLLRPGETFNVLMYYFHRYIRLTPAFALMVGITATWMGLLGTGPLWAEQVDGAGDICREHWWSALLYVANYVNPDHQCMMQSWYLMSDMQLHWLSPLLLYPLWRWRRYGLVWLAVLFVASCAVPFTLTFVYELPTPLPLTLDLEGQRWFMANMYYATQSRATSYICGALAGYVLFLIKTGVITRKLSRNEVRLGWLISTALCLSVVLGLQPLMDAQHYPYDVWRASMYAGFSRPAWCLGISWVVLACILGYGGPVNAFLSWTPFTILGRLSYGIYLTHAAIQVVDHGSIRSSKYFDDFKMVEKMLSDLVLTSFFGACLCLALESPISSIEKSLRSAAPRRTSSTKTIVTKDPAHPV